jgi:glycine/D-amino acid oxidase-like deaminating enzyme
MNTDVLIIGQGICGTFLSLELERAGLSCIVIDEERPFTASRAAAGLINPVTGRRIVKTWMIDELLPFAREAYREVGERLGGAGGDSGARDGERAGFIRQVSVVDFFPTPQMRVAFLKRYEEDPQYLQLPGDDHSWDACFRYELGYGLISPCWLVDMPGLLGAARKRMEERRVLRAERFELGELVVEAAGPRTAGGGLRAAEGPRGAEEGLQTGGSVTYKDIHAKWVIFCDGIESFTNPYFSRLPFAPNKGEALIVEIPDLGQAGGDAGRVGGDAGQAIFKKGISLVPWKEGLYWVGSSYEWSFTDPGPTAVFRERMEAVLKEWLRLPFRTVEHFASIRPATLERRPFVGLHPMHPAVGILNGMGTKGCSLAPWFARQLVDKLSKGLSIQADADILRFTKVLSRG